VRYFDHKTVAKMAGISDVRPADLKRIVGEEFQDDETMYELHVLRVCMAIRDRRVTIDRILGK
jgi:hypothetical protein